jgi:hypothetical protein
MAQLSWQKPANGSGMLAIAQIRWQRTRTYIRCRFSFLLSLGAAVSWSFAGFLTDLSPGVSQRSVIFLIGRDAGCCHLAVDDHSGETIAITQGDCPRGFRVVHVRTVAKGLVLGGAVGRLRRRGSGYRRFVVWSWGRAAGLLGRCVAGWSYGSGSRSSWRLRASQAWYWSAVHRWWVVSSRYRSGLARAE